MQSQNRKLTLVQHYELDYILNISAVFMCMCVYVFSVVLSHV